MPSDKPTIEKLQPGDPDTQSADVVAENITRLKALFPELVTEGKEGSSVNVDVLKQLVGDATVSDCDEKFGLNWHGKRRARQLALTPSTGTLRPCPEESVDWDTTQNLFIEGDNLEVLKLLQKSYAGRVKMIYIDPPYNTGNDFVYNDDFRDPIGHYMRITGQLGHDGKKLTSNPESSGRFHTDWLAMMYPRLRLARDLLRDDGAVFVSIDDNEVSHLRMIMDDVLGSENFLGAFMWKKMDSPSRNDAERITSVYHDYVIGYVKREDAKRLNKQPKPGIRDAYPLQLEDGTPARRRQLRKNGKGAKRSDRPTMWYPLTAPDGTEVWPKAPPPDDWEGRWVLSKETWKERDAAGLTEWIKRDYGWVPYYIETAPDDPTVPWSTWWDDLSQNRQAAAQFTGLMNSTDLDFDTAKPIDLIQRLLLMATTSEPKPSSEPDIVVDFFAGSGSTGHAVMAQNCADGGNRRFVLVQLPEVTGREHYGTIADLTKERLRRAGTKIKDELTQSPAPPDQVLDTGFRVFKLDSSNIREWEPSREGIAESLEAHVENLRTNRTEQDILYELLLKRGLDLCVPIETKEIAGKTVHSIGAGTLFACLSESITAAEGEPLALGIVAWHQDLDPAGDTTVVFRDSAFADDVVKTNVAAILDQSGLKNVRSL